MRPSSSANDNPLTAQDLAHLANLRIFFGHQSVGDDIVQGLKDVMASDPRLKLNIVNSADPQSVAGPAFIESHIGRNGDPPSKTQAFAAVVDRGMGREGGIAMFKYCYVDIDASTDIPRMFDNYRRGIDALKLKHPSLRIVHITVPLTTVEPGAKAWVKGILGRTTAREINRKRNEYNRLLVQTYGGTDPIFDLAEVESTHRDGSRSWFTFNNQKIFSLAPEFTVDGGHLNETGRRAAAQRLLRVLTEVSRVRPALELR